MNKEAEEYLYSNLRTLHSILDEERLPRAIIAKMVAEGAIATPKQAWRTLEKWARKGLYEYGTSIDLGWKIEQVQLLKSGD